MHSPLALRAKIETTTPNRRRWMRLSFISSNAEFTRRCCGWAGGGTPVRRFEFKLVLLPFRKQRVVASYVVCAAVERKRRMATRKNKPATTATKRNCGQTTSMPAPR